jgi:hypothetical protein
MGPPRILFLRQQPTDESLVALAEFGLPVDRIAKVFVVKPCGPLNIPECVFHPTAGGGDRWAPKPEAGKRPISVIARDRNQCFGLIVVPLMPAADIFGPPICGGPRLRRASPVPLIAPRPAAGDMTLRDALGTRRSRPPSIPVADPSHCQERPVTAEGETARLFGCILSCGPTFPRGETKRPMALRTGRLDARGTDDYTQGRTPVEIADRMNKELVGRELFSDYPLDNERLWFMIWQASGAPMDLIGDVEGICMVEPTFTMRQLNAEKLIARLAAKCGWNGAGFEAAKAEAARVAPKMHRARSRC